MKSNQQSPEELKETVRKKYSQVSEQGKDYNARTCCGTGGESNKVYNIMTDDYSDLDGYNAEADLGLGCGLPTQFAKINKGDTVIDLGSGAGNDCFVARYETGPEGKVIGIDFTEPMITKARQNADKLDFNNVEFRYGDIEEMPVSDNTADVIVSNCVLNLVPNKPKVFSEIHRVLKPGGHFSISDIVLEGDLPDALKSDAEMYAGCVAGAIQKNDYLDHIRESGFENVTIQKEKPIELPIEILQQYLDENEIERFNTSDTGIFSITVFAQKPDYIDQSKQLEEPSSLTDSESGCCSTAAGCC